MKFNLSFYPQKNEMDCGPTALQMVFEYLDRKPYSRGQLLNLVDSDRSGMTWTLGLAVAAAQLGFGAELFSINLGPNPESYNLEFYQEHADEYSSTEKKLENLKKQAIRLGVSLKEESLTLKEILSKLNESCISIVLLDWSKIKGTDKFIGHFVPIVGYDEENIYVHNQGSHKTMANFPIKRELFEEARKSAGTDEDIMFIYKKK